MFVNNKPQTYIEATSAGRKAFYEHVEALKEILNANQLPENGLRGNQSQATDLSESSGKSQSKER